MRRNLLLNVQHSGLQARDENEKRSDAPLVKRDWAACVSRRNIPRMHVPKSSHG